MATVLRSSATSVFTKGSEIVTIASVYAEPGGPCDVILCILEAPAREETGPLIIMGDFNAKHEVWGGEATDERGEAITDLAGAVNLEVANDRESEPTFETINGKN